MKRFLILIFLLQGNVNLFSQTPLSPNALHFDGNGDEVFIPGNSRYVIGTSDFTIEAMINFRGSTGGKIIGTDDCMWGFSFGIFPSGISNLWFDIPDGHIPG